MKISTVFGELDAAFSVEVWDGTPTIVFASRGGGRNHDYEEGQEVLLERLAALGGVVREVRLHPTHGQLGGQLSPAGFTFPLDLRSVPEVRALRRALWSAQARTDRKPGSKGSGNGTKRIRIFLDAPKVPDPGLLEEQLAIGKGIKPLPACRPPLAEALESLAVIMRGQISKGEAHSEGQGFGLSASERHAVERRAIAVATEHLEVLRFKVKDVGVPGSPYDLLCSRAGIALHVEVKGTTGGGDAVLLTKNEVEHAREYPYPALAIVSGIKLDEGVPPVAHGGKLELHLPWKVEEDRLEALAFRYLVPDADG